MNIFCALNDFDVWNLRVGKQRPMFSLDVSVAVFASSSTVDCREIARKSWITLLIDCVANVRSDKASLKQSTAREKLQGSKALNAIHCEQAIIWLASCARPSLIGISQNNTFSRYVASQDLGNKFLDQCDNHSSWWCKADATNSRLFIQHSSRSKGSSFIRKSPMLSPI